MTANEMPGSVWVPRGYFTTVKIKDDDVQMVLIAQYQEMKEKYEGEHELCQNMTTIADGLREEFHVALNKLKETRDWMIKREEMPYTFEEELTITMSEMKELDDILKGCK